MRWNLLKEDNLYKGDKPLEFILVPKCPFLARRFHCNTFYEHYSLQKEPSEEHHLVRFLANKFNVVKKKNTFTLKLKVKIGMHIEQCNVVVIIKYEIKNMKTLEGTIS